MIKSSDQYDSTLELLTFLSALKLTSPANTESTVLERFGDDFEECESCGYVLCECNCNDREGYSSAYDDEASFE